jgi:hypothetical protein
MMVLGRPVEVKVEMEMEVVGVLISAPARQGRFCLAKRRQPWHFRRQHLIKVRKVLGRHTLEHSRDTTHCANFAFVVQELKTCFSRARIKLQDLPLMPSKGSHCRQKYLQVSPLLMVIQHYSWLEVPHHNPNLPPKYPNAACLFCFATNLLTSSLQLWLESAARSMLFSANPSCSVRS